MILTALTLTIIFLGESLPESYLEVKFDKYADGFATDAERVLELLPHGQRYEALLGEL